MVLQVLQDILGQQPISCLDASMPLTFALGGFLGLGFKMLHHLIQMLTILVPKSNFTYGLGLLVLLEVSCAIK